MDKKAILPGDLSAPIGDYSPAILVGGGGVLYIAGQGPIGDGGRVEGVGDIKAQTRLVFNKIGKILAAVDVDFEAVVKTTVYLVNIDDRFGFQEARKEFFPKPPFPANTLVEVRRLVGEDWLLEVEAVACLPAKAK